MTNRQNSPAASQNVPGRGDAGRQWLPLSPFRKNIIELMRLSRRIPLVTACRRMELAPLVEARRNRSSRICWTAIVTKAFALVAATRPELRRACLTYPWPHLHQSHRNIATITVEREVGGELVPLFYHVRRPEEIPLARLHERLQQARTLPLHEFPKFRRMQALGRMPWPLRGALWRLAFHFSGKSRSCYFGTFGVSSTAASGAGITRIISPLTCTLHYGLISPDGGLDMYLTIDHRVLDGAPAARALADLERVMLTVIREEIETAAPR